MSNRTLIEVGRDLYRNVRDALLDTLLVEGPITRETASGIQFRLDKPDPAQVRLDDIASAISKLCRYDGACSRFYSVAEHCLLVADILPPELRIFGLLHDADEAYSGDISEPARKAIGYRRAKRLEDQLQAAILQALGLPQPDEVEREIIRSADRLALRMEAYCLLESRGIWAGDPRAILQFIPKHLRNAHHISQEEARKAWLEAVDTELGRRRPAPTGRLHS